MPSRSAASGVTEPGAPPRAGDALPEALEALLSEVEASAPSADFDARSWLWMLLLGVLLPVGLIAYGWWAAGGNR